MNDEEMDDFISAIQQGKRRNIQLILCFRIHSSVPRRYWLKLVLISSRISLFIGDYNAVKEALSNKLADANMRDKNGCPLLHWAAMNNRYAIVNLLIDW
jgi:ankyrin repeat protein